MVGYTDGSRIVGKFSFDFPRRRLSGAPEPPAYPGIKSHSIVRVGDHEGKKDQAAELGRRGDEVNWLAAPVKMLSAVEAVLLRLVVLALKTFVELMTAE
ncbi:hypothetical protein PGTUg99_001980 [Puccinia graminis f. sp. tritici]|uniref:Uncharacterized protein n=1 Tax=Puccinia graminis f. sp. tritici TaxID=56615 RepID=A0A5B0N8C7_PUCGR|nr:hypothetical protein PGTUg99_001980 [Puccinia graminis f. sp. tritici]